MTKKLTIEAIVMALGSSSGNGLAEEITVVSESETKKADPRMACQIDQHRGFDFWLGKWKVATPARPNWHASSQIAVGNNGCSIHEAYKTPDGYA